MAGLAIEDRLARLANQPQEPVSAAAAKTLGRQVVTNSPNQGEKLLGYGALLIGIAAFPVVVAVLRRWFPDALPWHLLRSYRPPVEPWQFWTFVTSVFLMGVRMVVLGHRAARRAAPDAAPR